jgi:hypothetical protein
VIPIYGLNYPELQKLMSMEINIGTREMHTDKVEQKTMAYFRKENPIFALSETNIVVLLPIAVLPYRGYFAPNFSGKAHLISLGVDCLTTMTETFPVIMPPNSWLIMIMAKNGKNYYVQDTRLEVINKKTNNVRTMHMPNVFPDGRLCMGDQLPRIMDMDWKHTVIMFIDAFFTSLWNNHLQSPSQHLWLRWDFQGNYILPDSPLGDYTRNLNAGSQWSHLVP